MPDAQGYAVAENSHVIVSSVSATRQGAIVNWLVTNAGYRVTNDWTERQLDHVFDTVRRNHDAEVVQVRIIIATP